VIVVIAHRPGRTLYGTRSVSLPNQCELNTNLGQVLLQWLSVHLRRGALFPSLSETNIHPLSPQKALENSDKFIHHGLMLGVAVVSINELCWPEEGYPKVVRPSGTMISPLSVVYDGVRKPGIITESIPRYCHIMTQLHFTRHMRLISHVMSRPPLKKVFNTSANSFISMDGWYYCLSEKHAPEPPQPQSTPIMWNPRITTGRLWETLVHSFWMAARHMKSSPSLTKIK
jgi:hypothetical protein